jgi:hypothetical protein
VVDVCLCDMAFNFRDHKRAPATIRVLVMPQDLVNCLAGTASVDTAVPLDQVADLGSFPDAR